mmetsp:Transcript_25934/g.80129  ORF Transcript_25934/g.80129 Transcript_25934/m.80129 type:complete len:1073 (-) Transcript_25934:17-3235(-)
MTGDSLADAEAHRGEVEVLVVDRGVEHERHRLDALVQRLLEERLELLAHQDAAGLGVRHEAVVHEQTTRGGHHAHVDAVALLDRVDGVADGDVATVADLDLVPHREGHLAAVVGDVLGALGHLDGLRQRDERQGDVDEGVAEQLALLGADEVLEHLDGNQAGDERRRRDHRGDDLARDHLGLDAVGDRDAVVGRAQVRRGGDEVDVPVGVVILLKLLRGDLQPLVLRRIRHVSVRQVRGGDGRRVLLLLRRGVGARRVLDAAGDEGRDRGRLRDRRHLRRWEGLQLGGQAVNARDDARGAADEEHVQLVGAVEVQRRRRAARAAPERLAVRGDEVGRHVVQQLADVQVERVLEAKTRPRDAVLRRRRALRDAVDERFEHRRLVARVAGKPREEPGGVAQVRRGVGRPLHEVPVERVARPLDRVLDGARGVLERAQRDVLLRRVGAVAVVLREVRNDALRVALGAERARLEQRALEVDAALVDVLAGDHVVQRVHDDALALPEGLVEDVLRLAGDLLLQRLDAECLVDLHGGARGDGRLGLADVVAAEEELAAQVGELDRVHVRDGDLGGRRRRVLGATEANHGDVLDVLAAERAGADDERGRVLERLLERAAEDGDLPVVAAVERRTLRLGRHDAVRHRLDHLAGVVMKPLEHGGELARAALEHLLRREAADEARHRVQVAVEGRANQVQQLLAQVRAGRGGESCEVDGGGDGRVRRRVRRDLVQAAEERVQLAVGAQLRLVIEDKVEVGGVERRLEGLALDGHGLLRRVHVAAALEHRSGLQGAFRLHLDLHRERRNDFEHLEQGRLRRVRRVEHRAPLHVGEVDLVARLRLVLLVVVQHDDGVVLVDVGDDARDELFPVLVVDNELIAGVHKYGARDAARLARDEADAVGAAQGVLAREQRRVLVAVDHDVLLQEDVVGAHVVAIRGRDGDRGEAVELRQARLERLGHRLADVGLIRVEDGGQVVPRDRGIVDEGDLLDAGKDEVLGHLAARAAEADDGDAHLAVLALRLGADDVPLAVVQLLLDRLVVHGAHLAPWWCIWCWSLTLGGTRTMSRQAVRPIEPTPVRTCQ